MEAGRSLSGSRPARTAACLVPPTQRRAAQQHVQTTPALIDASKAAPCYSSLFKQLTRSWRPLFQRCKPLRA